MGTWREERGAEVNNLSVGRVIKIIDTSRAIPDRVEPENAERDEDDASIMGAASFREGEGRGGEEGVVGLLRGAQEGEHGGGEVKRELLTWLKDSWKCQYTSSEPLYVLQTE